PPAKKLLADGTISAGHAILLARLKPDQQKAAIGDPEEGGGGLLTHENVPEGPDSDEMGPEPVKAVSVREFAGWIDEHVKFDTKAVDPMVFPETAEVILAADKIVPITHNHYIQPDARDKQRIFGPRS